MSRSKARQTTRVLPILNARARTHLLANALSLIASLLRRRPDAAEDLLAHLGRLLHETVADAQPFVPLATEMASALSFLGLERARLGGRLRRPSGCAAVVYATGDGKRNHDKARQTTTNRALVYKAATSGRWERYPAIGAATKSRPATDGRCFVYHSTCQRASELHQR